jgi:hypothetical protein
MLLIGKLHPLLVHFPIAWCWATPMTSEGVVTISVVAINGAQSFPPSSGSQSESLISELDVAFLDSLVRPRPEQFQELHDDLRLVLRIAA